MFVSASIVFGSAQLTASPEWSARIDQQMRESRTVVVGRARSVSARWQDNSRGDRLIVSRVVLDVEETLKGRASERIAVDLPGGTVDGITLRVSGMAVIAAGDRTVLFLDDTAAGAYVPHRGAAGVLGLDQHERVKGTMLRLHDVRTAAVRAGQGTVTR